MLTERTKVPTTNIVQAGKNASPRRVCHLNKIYRRCRDREADTESKQKSSRHESANIMSACLDDSPDDDKDGTNAHTKSTAIQVTSCGNEKASQDLTDTVESEDSTDGSTLHSHAKVAMERIHGIDRRHDGSIEAISTIICSIVREAVVIGEGTRSLLTQCHKSYDLLVTVSACQTDTV